MLCVGPASFTHRKQFTGSGAAERTISSTASCSPPRLAVVIADFCNKICHNRTFKEALGMSEAAKYSTKCRDQPLARLRRTKRGRLPPVTDANGSPEAGDFVRAF